jgi:hypothetical protein
MKNLALEIRQVANLIAIERPDVATRLLNIAVKVQRLELQMDDIAADAQLAEAIREQRSHAGPTVIEFHPRRWRP